MVSTMQVVALVGDGVIDNIEQFKMDNVDLWMDLDLMSLHVHVCLCL